MVWIPGFDPSNFVDSVTLGSELLGGDLVTHDLRSGQATEPDAGPSPLKRAAKAFVRWLGLYIVVTVKGGIRLPAIPIRPGAQDDTAPQAPEATP